MTDNSPLPVDAVEAGAAVYNRPLLSIYDLWVLGFSNSYIWRCPTPVLLDFYNEHISGNHLDVGVGTGYFLDKCTFPIPRPHIALADLNKNSLLATAGRLERYKPLMYVANVMEPMTIRPAGFESIGLSYLLHCLPGTIPNKASAIRNLMPLLEEDTGVMFGSTILGVGVKHNFLGRVLMRAYNDRRIFSNYSDNVTDLEFVLQKEFREYSIRVVGTVALFMGKV